MAAATAARAAGGRLAADLALGGPRSRDAAGPARPGQGLRRLPGGAPGWTVRYYGFLGVAWPGLEKVTLALGGKPLHLRYRVYVHRGDAAEGRVAEAYAAYASAHR